MMLPIIVENFALIVAKQKVELEYKTLIGEEGTLSGMAINTSLFQPIHLLPNLDNFLNIVLLWKKFLDDFLIPKKLFTISIIINSITAQKT